MIHFKLAELRKKNGLTQQELAEVLNVSYQTISKWENSVTFPDITILPEISSYFGVSVDALLGLVPLEQEYHPSNSGRAEYWEKSLEDPQAHISSGLWLWVWQSGKNADALIARGK